MKVNVRSNLVVRAGEASASALTPGRSRRGGPVVLQHQHGLEQGLAAEARGGVKQLHQALEGQVLVGISFQAGGADALKQFDERGIAAGVGAQHQGVDEEADEVIQSGLGASGDGRADGDVGARAQLA